MAASLSFFIYSLLDNIFHVFKIRQVVETNYYMSELYLFFILGVIEGLITSAYAHIFSRYLVYKRGTGNVLLKNRFVYIAIITSLIALITYGHDNFKFGIKT